MARPCKAQRARAGRCLNLMPPEHFRFGGGATDTVIHPLVVLYLLISVALTLTLPRGKAITPFLLAFFTIPMGQVVVLGGLHFTALRILILVGLVRRAIFRGSSSRGKFPGGYNTVDWAVVLFSISSVVVFLLEFMEMPAVITGLGDLVDLLGGYLVVRFLIPDGVAMRRAIKALVAVCVIQGACMINERISHINLFGMLGGIPLAAAVRDGMIRAAGSLGALTAGPFAGVLIPMFLWLWTQRGSRMIAYAGLAAATAMVITSNSSTSLMALGGSLLGLSFWPLRKHMRQIRWGLVIMLTGLHMVMKAPVWSLIARVDLTGSSSSWQRYLLVDMTIRHFGEWWLMGTKDYVNWGWGSWDTCNQFVDVAVKGGLLTLIFYIAILKGCFGAIGRARKVVNGDRGQEWLLWCLGSALFATIVAQFGINYAVPLINSLFALVAFICVATFEARRPTGRNLEALGDDQLVPSLAAVESPVLPSESAEHTAQLFRT